MSVAIPSLRAAIAVPPWVKNELWRRARTVPSLDLRFADNKSLVDAVTGASLITFTRASDGTFTNSAGVLQTAAADVPRFDHNPITGESLGLLVEEQRTNLLLQSEDFSTTWARTLITAFGSGSASDVETAPDGTLTADLIATLSGNNSGTGFVGQTITKSATATTYTVTVFAKAQNWNTVRLQVNDAATNNNRATVAFSLATGVITTAAVAFGTFSAVSAAPASSFVNGWFKANLTFTTSTETGLLVRIFPDNSSTVTADGTSGIYVWGADLQAGAFPTSYIPTTTTAVTRSADVASITGTNFSSWYRQDEGTFYVLASPAYPFTGANSFPRIFAVSDGGVSNMIDAFNRVLSPFTDSAYAVATGGVQQANYETASNTIGKATSFKYGANDFVISVGGATPISDTTGTVPTVNKLDLGSLPNQSAKLNGHIRRLVYWGQRLPNNVLQAITQ